MMTAIGMVRAGIGLTISAGISTGDRGRALLRSRRINDANFSRPVALIKKAGRTLPCP